jgi:hypothetical protein
MLLGLPIAPAQQHCQRSQRCRQARQLLQQLLQCCCRNSTEALPTGYARQRQARTWLQEGVATCKASGARFNQTCTCACDSLLCVGPKLTTLCKMEKPVPALHLTPQQSPTPWVQTCKQHPQSHHVTGAVAHQQACIAAAAPVTHHLHQQQQRCLCLATAVCCCHRLRCCCWRPFWRWAWSRLPLQPRTVLQMLPWTCTQQEKQAPSCAPIRLAI